MKNFYDVRFTTLVRRHYHQSILASSKQEAIDLARSGDAKNYEEELVDSFDFRASVIEDDEARE